MNTMSTRLKKCIGVPLVVLATSITTSVSADSNTENYYLCESDCKMEFNFFRKYSKQGATLADLALAIMYHRGQGTEVNHKVANRHLRRAAKEGEPGAQYQLGYFLQHGIYMDRDLERAEYWMQKAATQNVRDSKARLAVIRQLQQQQKLARNSSETSAQERYKTRAKVSHSPSADKDVEVIKISFNLDYKAVLEAARSQTCNLNNCIDQWDYLVMAPMILLESDQFIEPVKGSL